MHQQTQLFLDVMHVLFRLRAVIKHLLGRLILPNHDNEDGGKSSFQLEETFKECSSSLLASPLI